VKWKKRSQPLKKAKEESVEEIKKDPVLPKGTAD